jgi:lipoprotein-anchoring transpeptidase ErfK/SrfK
MDLESEDCYKNPTILKDDSRLSAGIEQANKITDVTVTYDFQYTTEKVDKTVIKDWITFDDEMNASLDYDKVLDYIEDLAAKYDTYSSIRTVKDASGTEHKVYYGSYGWKISQTKEAKQLMKVIKAGKDVTREPIYLYEAVCRKEGNIDWDDTYVCVNITNQSMVYIKDGKAVLSSSIVTGDPTKGHSTPTGAYQVMYKERDATLSGQGYSSPVKYWMPFTTNVGFHDASWQPYFGGSRYMGGGSHGCVNMPSGNAAALYQILEKGTPVFVYK